jgi:hypothetical protein
MRQREQPDDERNPVAAAQRILHEAASPEIDWSRNPIDDRERELRAAILRVIEREIKATFTLPDWESIALSTWRGELLLLGDGAEMVGSDLYDEIERVEELAKAERVARQRRKRQKIMLEAVADAQRSRNGGRL